MTAAGDRRAGPAKSVRADVSDSVREVAAESANAHAGAGIADDAEGAARSHTTVERVSVVVPVRDEERTIARLLDGLLAQTRLPDEIVITDGGSTDATRDVIRRYQKNSPVRIELVETDEALPGRGRNLAIGRASSEWVACIDAGIVPRSDWLEELIEAAGRERDAGIVFGRYEAATDSFFTECAAMVYAPAPGSLTRSIASCLMRRSAWREAGGFREDLRSGEDLVFFHSLEAAGVRRAFTGGSVVRWSLKPSAASTFRHFSTYSRHNMRAGLFAEWQLRVCLLYALMTASLLAGALLWRPLLLAAPLVLLARAARRIYNWHGASERPRLWREMFSPRRVLGVVWVNLVVDAAMFRGMLEWLRRDVLKA